MVSRKKKSSSPRKKSNKPFYKRWQFWFAWLLKFAIVGCVIFAVFAVYLDARVRNKLTERLWQSPAQVYSRALHLYPEMPLSLDDFQRELDLLGYRSNTELKQPGDVVRQSTKFKVYRRAFAFEDKTEPAQQLYVHISDSRIVDLRDGKNNPLDLARLDPISLGSMFTTDEDRVLVQLKDVPPLLTKSLLLVEDRNFYHHFGLSPRGIARAMFANARAGQAVQGGSTLTQQLVKNVFLTNERKLQRKINEAVMSLLVEYHYDKDTILEAYLNEIFLGQEGPRPIHGFALASRHYFNRPLDELRSDQIAMLVGLVKGPSQYDPWRHPERAKERRDLVLKVMADGQVIDNKEYEAAVKRDLGLAKKKAQDSLHPGYLDLVRRQLRRDYQERDLQVKGLRIFTAFNPQAQWHAERSLERSLNQLDPKDKGLEGSMVVTDVVSGEVIALVGGRDMHFAGFNRALDALRPIGSLVKPAVYLSALESKRFTLISKLDDSAVNVKVPGGRWQPKNYDKQFHGDVPLHYALAESYNAATAHLGLDLGLPKVLATMQRLGVERELPVVPAVLLGAAELSPLEVAVMYQTIAAQGVNAGLRSIRAITDIEGIPLARYPQKPVQAVSPAAIHTLQYAMQEVMTEGTARSAKNVLPNLRVAGKTGTTDDMRDSWFAGFAGDYLAVVWMGRDDNKPTGLSGATGALKAWLGFMAETSHVSMNYEVPEGVNYAWVNEMTGLVSAEHCAGATYVPFIEGTEPTTVDGTCESNNSVLRWFQQVF